MRDHLTQVDILQEVSMSLLLDVTNWLCRGGRIRLLQSITTNGGVVFEAGEELRLTALVPYASSDLYWATFASASDSDKTIYLSGVELTEERVEFLEH